LATIGFILGTSALVILYGRGYRLNIDGEKIVNSTGTLAATSDPVGAQIFVNGAFTTATNTSFSIEPGTHTIRILKDGYLPWQKDIAIQKEVVSRADAFLFPINPSLSPLTNNGIIKPLLSPDGSKIVYLSPAKEVNGIKREGHTLWVHELADRTLGFNRDPREIAFIEPAIAIQTIALKWSPDSTSILFSTPTVDRLYTPGRNTEMRIVTQQLESILKQWQREETEKQERQLSAFKQDFINVATASARIISFSPDESKVLYEATATASLPIIINPPLIGANTTKEERTISPGKLYVYDRKEDKNYFLLDKNEIAPSPTPTPTTRRQRGTTAQSTTHSQQPATTIPIYWFPTNRHLILAIDKKIDIMEYDRTNWVTVYAGPFEENFIAPWPGGSRIVVLTNLNPGASPLPNLFTVNLR
jgi:hypothetical protein